MNNIFKKIMTDQLLMGPICIFYFFTGMGLLEGKSISNIKDEMKSKFLVVYKVSYHLTIIDKNFIV